MCWRLCSRVGLLKLDVTQEVEALQEREKSAHDKHSLGHSFQEGDMVYAKNYVYYGPKWLPGGIWQTNWTKLHSGGVTRFGRLKTSKSIKDVPQPEPEVLVSRMFPRKSLKQLR